MEIAETQDLWFAVYIFHRGIDPVDIIDCNNNRKIFRFNENMEYLRLKKSYYQGEAKVNPRQYKWGFRRLKAIISN